MFVVPCVCVCVVGGHHHSSFIIMMVIDDGDCMSTFIMNIL
jgi:hypothetical protein